MSKIVPEIAVSNMGRSLEFYGALGFTKTQDGVIDENGSQWSSLTLGDSELWLTRQDVMKELQEGQLRGNGVTIYVTVDDVDAVHERVRAAGGQMNVVKELETIWYGLRQFSIADPDGYVLTINTPVAPAEGGETAGAES